MRLVVTYGHHFLVQVYYTATTDVPLIFSVRPHSFFRLRPYTTLLKKQTLFLKVRNECFILALAPFLLRL